MGNTGSHFLPDEAALFTAFSSETAWGYDEGDWLRLLNLKQSLNTLTPGLVFRDLKGFLERLRESWVSAACFYLFLGPRDLWPFTALFPFFFLSPAVRNDRSSHNVATLMALVAVRLPRAWYFSSTDLELTTNAVVLLRYILRFFISQLTAQELAAHLGASANPGKTRNPDLEKVSGNFPAFVSSLLDFLALSPLKDEQHIELHTQVSTLLLALLSTQLVEPDVIAAASLLSGEPPLSSADPGLAATMALGSQPVGALTGASGSASSSKGQQPSAAAAATPGGSSSNPSRAAVLIGALLRNIAVDGARDEDFEPAPPESSSAFEASKLVDTARGLAYKAAAATGNTASPLPPTVTTSSEAKEISTWGSVPSDGSDGGLMSTVANAASAIAAVPGSVLLPAVGVTSAAGPGGDLPRPLAERSALLLLLLTHNCRSGLAGLVNAAAAAATTPSTGTPSSNLSSSSTTDSAQLTALQQAANPYRYVLSCMTDADDPAQSAAISLTPSAATSSASSNAAASAGGGNTSNKSSKREALAFPGGATSGLRIKFRSTFLALKNVLNSPLGTVLFYTLFHGCPAFAEFTLSRSDVDEQVVLPLCKQLYYAGCLSPEHRYMLIIALLLLSQDAAFCENIHRRIKVKGGNMSWFAERRLGGDITLGSLLVILLVRLITAPPSNPSVTSSSSSSSSSTTSSSVANDAYLHSNCLAVLANFAPHFHGLNVYAAQKLVGMLGTLHKRHTRAVARLQQTEAAFRASQAQEQAAASASGALVPGSPAPAGTSAAELAIRIELLSAEVNRLDSAVRVSLETLHAALHPGNLGSNLTLLYQLLHARKTILAPVANDPVFSDDASGVAEVAAHFSDILKKEEEKRALEAARSGGSGNVAAASSSASTASAAVQDGAALATATTTTTSSPTTGLPPVVWEEEDVEAVLAGAVLTWKGGAPQAASDAANALREAKFAYEEDSSPEVFFCPFLWSMTLQFTSDVGWREFERDAAVPTRLIPLSPAVGLYPAVPLPATTAAGSANNKAKASSVAAVTTPAAIAAGASAVATTGGAGATPLAAAV